MSSVAAATGAGPVAQVSRLRTGGRSLWHDKAALLGLVFLVLLVVVAVFAPLLAPHSPSEPNLVFRLRPPAWESGGSTEYLLGTDLLGRDVLSRLMYGARLTLLLSVIVVIVAGTVGTTLGLIAGYRGGRLDTVVMRLADAQLAFPGLLLVLMVLAFVGTSMWAIIGVLSVYGWMIYARMVRSMTLHLRETPAVQAAILVGCGTPRILIRHILPNLSSALLTQAMLELARIVLVEAALSYLGLGIQPPNASWGLMVAENQQYIQTAWWTIVFPGVAISLTVLAMNLVANWLRVQSDPQQRQRRLIGTSMRKLRKAGSFAQGRRGAAATAPEAAPLLELRGLEVRFHTAEGDVSGVRDASLKISRGETVGVVGESGSGKSTMALSLMDLVPPPGQPARGEVLWEGREMTRKELHGLRGSEIAMIFQDPMVSLNPLLTVVRQVGETLVKHDGMNRRQARERAEELLGLVGIPSPRERLDQYPHELSGGLRQRVMIAAALAANPKLIIADEPTTALDATVQAQILELIASLQQELGIAMLLITHDLGVVARVCDRVVVMYGGRVVEEAPTEELFADPRHPYTRALMTTVPRVEQAGDRMQTIPGHPPRATDVLPGCMFAPRCAFATERCEAVPELISQSGRRLACWNPQ